jgi:hypothetical protein
MRKWLLTQLCVTLLSWSIAALIVFQILTWIGADRWLSILLAVTLSGIYPVLSLAELSVMRLFGRRSRVGLVDCLVSNVFVVAMPLAFGYSWVVGECLTCGPILSLLIFSALSVALPISLVHWVISDRLNGR